MPRCAGSRQRAAEVAGNLSGRRKVPATSHVSGDLGGISLEPVADDMEWERWHAGAMCGRYVMARAVGDLLADPDRAAEMGRAGRDWVVDEWQWRTKAQRLSQLLAG